MPEVMTFPRFMENHYGEVLGDRQLLSPYARLLVINHLLREGQFGYLEKAQPSYGLSQKISEALGHLQASLLVDEERNELIQQLTAESPEKSKTVELLDQAYHRFLAEHRLADENVLNVELLLKWQRDGYPESPRPPFEKPIIPEHQRPLLLEIVVIPTNSTILKAIPEIASNDLVFLREISFHA